MTDVRSVEARFSASIKELDAEQPDEYFYRVDSYRSVRTIRRHPVFRPRRWDFRDRFPHMELLDADSSKLPNEAIFRLSLWRTRAAAMKDWRFRSTEHIMTLMRVRRSTVRRALEGWTFTDDDHLPDAELIWKLGTVAEDFNEFYVGGVPLAEFEIFDAVEGRWSNWLDSTATVPDRVRLASIGWSPIAIHTRQGGPGMAYWVTVPAESHLPRGSAFWCLLTLDEDMQGTLGTEDPALTRVMPHLLRGPLRELGQARVSLLTLTPARDRVWTEEFDLVWSRGKARWPRWLRSEPEPLLHLQPCTRLGRDEIAELISRSRLASARPEFRRSIWTLPC